MGGIVSSIFGGGGGGGGSPAPASTAPTSQNITTSNIAPWAQPGVSNLINAASNQIFTDPSQTQLRGYTPFNANTPAGQEWVQGAAGSVAGFSPLQQQAQQNVANMQTPDQYGQAMDMSTAAGLGALGTTGQAAGYGGLGAIAGRQGQLSGLSYGANATNPSAVQAYMNPYLQATLAPSLQLLNQQYGIQNVANQAQATQQGAFGGGRQAVMQGLNQQNQDLATNQLVGQAYNQAYNTANQNMQNAASLGMQGAGLGIQGAQAGLQGVGAQQAGYAGLGSQATNLGNLAGAQTQTGLNINAAQQQAGALQQQNQQNILNQAMANYNTAQTYPMTQLAQLESLYTGAPQNITSSTYSAAPSTVSQLAGLAGTAIAGAKLAGAKKGGSVKDIKKMAGGGGIGIGGAIGSVESSLENMDAAELENTIKTSSSPFIREKAKELLPLAIQRGAGLAGARSGQSFAAGGGIVAFASGDLVGNTQDQEDLEGGVSGTGQLSTATAPQGPMSGGLRNVTSYLDQLKALGYGKPTQDDLDLRAQLKEDRANAIKDREKNKWLALLEGSGAALSSTSPFANVGIGNMVSTGTKAYAAGEKDYADQLAKLRSGELDLNKLSSTDRNNLLHYAMTGATSESNTEMRTKELLEAARLRNAQVGGANADRAQNKLLAIASQFYTADLKAAQDKLGIDKVTEDMKQTIYNNAMRRASQVPDMLKKGAKGGPKVGASEAPVDPAQFDRS